MGNSGGVREYMEDTKQIETEFLVSSIKILLMNGFTMQEIFDDLVKQSKKMISELTKEEQQGIVKSCILRNGKKEINK